MNYRAWILLGLLLPGWLLPGWASAAKNTAAASCSLLIVGDSLSSGYGLASGSGWVDKLDARLKKSAPAWRAVNASVSGDTTQNGLQRLPPALARQRPHGVLIALGGNDGLRGVAPAEIRRNLHAMIHAARASGAWVVLLEAPVLPNYGRAYAAAVAKLYADLAREEKIVHVPCFVCAAGVTPGRMQPDGIHPNEQAQMQMLDVVWPHIQPKLACAGEK